MPLRQRRVNSVERAAEPGDLMQTLERLEDLAGARHAATHHLLCIGVGLGARWTTA